MLYSAPPPQVFLSHTNSHRVSTPLPLLMVCILTRIFLFVCFAQFDPIYFMSVIYFVASTVRQPLTTASTINTPIKHIAPCNCKGDGISLQSVYVSRAPVLADCIQLIHSLVLSLCIWINQEKEERRWVHVVFVSSLPDTASAEHVSCLYFYFYCLLTFFKLI